MVWRYIRGGELVRGWEARAVAFPR